jgi:hypothetical protein
LEMVVMGSRAWRTDLIIGCGANSHHTSWGSTNINNSGESLFNCNLANVLDIVNKGNKPTFVTSNRHKVIDITIASLYDGNFVKIWNVTGEVTSSDHRHIQFTVTGIDCSAKVYCNPHRTDRVSLRTDLSGCLGNMTDKIINWIDLETAARQFQDAIVFAYNENFPLTVRSTRKRRDGIETLQRTGGFRKVFNAAKNSGNWTVYKSLDYNKSLR